MGYLSSQLANKFINKISSSINFNVNIMNEKGVIIASKDKSRIGDFHQVAYNMLSGKMEDGRILKCDENKYINTKAGVNKFIDYDHKHIGVICVTGNPSEVNSFAELVKSSIEVMLEYELHEKNRIRIINDVERFMYYLLVEENIKGNLMKTLASNLNIKDNTFRVGIMIRNHTPISNEEIMKRLENNPKASKLDLMTSYDGDMIELLKYIDSDDDSLIVNYRSYLDDYFQFFFHELSEIANLSDITIFVGTLQNKINHYRDSFACAMVLRKNIKMGEGVHYFTDSLYDYLRKQISKDLYGRVFSMYLDYFDANDRKMLIETVSALRKNNYNVVNSAKDLFIHRNTMVFRLNKYKTMLNIDPIINYNDREWLNELAYFFSSIEG